MELFKLLGTIAIDNAGANKALDDTSQQGEKTQGKLSKTFSAIGSGAAKVGKAVMTGMAVGGAAVAGLATKAISSYADFEQLVGGVETLFGAGGQSLEEYAKSVGKSVDDAKAEYDKLQSAQTKVFINSANAYKTAGMSQNEYMETVTSFSAALISSLEGDTVKAAQVADQAIIDMSDNANKMGSSMESIQNAYQGFAKQNYTMLDNLKLGYGGTKEEMARLLKDAEKLSGQKFDISSYADVVEAIHVIQTEMGITGTTAKEASSTISGSIGMMKASWTNLVTGIASGNGDIYSYIDEFVESVGTVADNLIPVIGTALDGIVIVIQELAPKIIAEVPKLASQLLPSVIETATSLIQALVDIIPDLVQAIVDAIPAFIDGFMQIINAIVQALPTIMQSLVQALPTLIPMLVTALVQMIVMLCQVLPQIIQPIIDNLPLIITTLVNALIMNLPILIQGLIQLVGALIQAIPQILSALWTVITDYCSQGTSALFAKIKEWILQLFPQSGEAIWSVLVTIKNYFVMWINNIKAVLSVVLSVISTPFKLAWNAVKLIWSVVVDYFKMIWNNIKAVFAVVDSVLSGDFKGAWESIKQIWSNVKQFFSSVVDNVKQAFSNVFKILSEPFEKAKEAIGKIVDNIKGFFTGLKLEFPSIKIPKFSVKPKGWKIGDLLEGTIPKLGIEWHAKAMRNPMIMTRPTVFGYDAASGKLLGGGEAGSEVVSGTGTLMNMISSAVAGQNTALLTVLYKILEAILQMDANMGGNLREAISDLRFHVNNREFGRLVKGVI